MKDFKHLMNLAIIGSALVMGTASADQQILDDLIVDGSACIGFDCVNGESFGFDTLRLKENNLRIHFQDTSTSASFPTADWRIVANDTSNGGAEYLAFEDSDLGRQTFKVFHGARSNALVVKDNKIGLGTLTPVVELEIVDGDTPTVRLKQDGSSGFTPQTWDIAGNETNYFIRDVTNGSKLPFRIRPGAPTSSIDIAGSGDVGIGDSSPDAKLDVQGNVLINNGGADSVTSSLEDLHIYDDGPSRFAIENTTATEGAPDTGTTHQKWTFNSNGTLRISGGTDAAEFILDGTGDLTILGNITTSGSCAGGCDRVFDTDYDLPTIEDHADYMFTNRHLQGIGATSETGPFNLTEKVGGLLNELEKAHIYIAQLNAEIKDLKNEKDQTTSAFEKRLSKLEKQ